MTPPEFFDADDGTRLSYRSLGEGRPLILLHGFFSSGTANWIARGHADALVARGHRVIVPDLRAHGRSAKPGDPAAYPPDVLADDALALAAHLDLADYDLAGYSLGARTVIRLLLRNAPIGRAVVAGQGLRSLSRPTHGGHADFFRRVLSTDEPFTRGTQEWVSQQWLRKMGGDRTALLRVLDTSGATTAEELASITTPTLVITGEDDAPQDARALADLLPNGSYAAVPGDHFVAAGRPELVAGIADHLSC